MQLREYQLKAIQLIWEAFKKFQAIVLCLPTGGGKTVIFSEVAKTAIAAGVPVMILCNKKELIKQAVKKLNSHGIFPTVIDPDYKIPKVSMCYVASVDTLRNRVFPVIGLLIIDEGHIRSFDPIALEYKARIFAEKQRLFEITSEYKSRGVKILCCTATPERTGKKLLKEDTRLGDLYPKYTGQMGDIYETIIEPTTIKELLELGYLEMPTYYGPEMDLSNIKTKGGDFDEDDLFEKFNKPKLYSGVIENYRKYADGKKMICFCINVEHSLKTAEAFTLAGIPAEHVDGNSKDRDKILERFAQGKTMILCNFGITTTGYDEPTVEGIILYRATKIHSLYMQMVGRGARPCKEIGKDGFIVIDHGSHLARLGWWEQEHKYSLDLKFVSKTVGAGPIRYCETCEAIIPLSKTICPHCNVAQEKQEAELKLYEANFVKLEKPDHINKIKPLHQMTVGELESSRIDKEYKLGWIVRQLIPRGYDALLEYANLKGYSKAWVNEQLKWNETSKEDIEKKRIDNKKAIFDWMRTNKHVTPEFLQDYASKKLRLTHSPEEINTLIPKVLNAFGELKLGILK
jgi:superfamily II DNA or RNA helicase